MNAEHGEENVQVKAHAYVHRIKLMWIKINVDPLSSCGVGFVKTFLPKQTSSQPKLYWVKLLKTCKFSAAVGLLAVWT